MDADSSLSYDIKGGIEDCMEMNHQIRRKWNDVSCDRSDRGLFVCKKSNSGMYSLGTGLLG